jgi:hypothetical protein
MVSWFKQKPARSAAGLWPKSALLAALRRRYSAVDELGEEGGFSLYGVTDGELRFGVIFALVEDAPDSVFEVGFFARFTGYQLSEALLERINRNLHLSVAAVHNDGDLYLIGGVAATGEFNDSAFALVLEAWKRDLLIVLQALSSSASFAEAFPAARLESIRRFAANPAPQSGGADLFAAFAAGEHRALSLCPDCRGRGKIGFIARTCSDCDGSGFVKRRGRTATVRG